MLLLFYYGGHMEYIKAKSISYASKKRNKKDVRFIVLHYTGNKGDTAKGNATYFKTSNNREAGAHFFVDRSGNTIKSIAMERVAWAVGGAKYTDCAKTGGGKLYGKCTNYNSVSIELCDILDKKPSEKQIEAIKETIKYIRKYCVNAKYITFHWCVNGKHCPLTMMKPEQYKPFLKAIGEEKNFISDENDLKL